MWVEALLFLAWLVVFVLRQESAEKGRIGGANEPVVHPRKKTDSVTTISGSRASASGWLAYGGLIPESRTGDHPWCGPIHAIGRSSNQVESGAQAVEIEFDEIAMARGGADDPAFQIEKVKSARVRARDSRGHGSPVKYKSEIVKLAGRRGRRRILQKDPGKTV